MKQHFLVLITSLLLCACVDHDSDEKVSAYPADTIAVVNADPITEAYFNRYAAERLAEHANSFDPSERDTVLSELIKIQLILQHANASGFSTLPDVKTELLFWHNKTLTKMMLKQELGNVDVSEQALQKAYEESKQLSHYKYKARHVLLNTEVDALNVIDKLRKGENFITLAEKYSLGTSGKTGGDLGWFTPQTMDPTFAHAVMQMKTGSFTITPVHTQFGWHVILLEEVQKTDIPPFNELRDTLEKQVRENALQHYIEALKQKATIKILP